MRMSRITVRHARLRLSNHRLAAKALQGGRTYHAVGADPFFSLKCDDSRLSASAKIAIDRYIGIAQLNEKLLEDLHVVATVIAPQCTGDFRAVRPRTG